MLSKYILKALAAPDCESRGSGRLTISLEPVARMVRPSLLKRCRTPLKYKNHIIIALAVMLILLILTACGGGGGGGGGNPPGNDPPGDSDPGDSDPGDGDGDGNPGDDGDGGGGGGGTPVDSDPVDNPPPVVIVTPPTVTISFQANTYVAVQGGADANLVLEIKDSGGNLIGAPTDYMFNLTTANADVADYQIWDGTTQIAGGGDFIPEIAFAENDTSKTLRIVAVNTPIAPLNLLFPNSTNSQYLHSSERTEIYLLASAASIVTFSTASITATEGDDVTVTLNLNPARTLPTDIKIFSGADLVGFDDIELLNATTLAELPADGTRKIVTVPAGDTSVEFIIRFVAGGTSEVPPEIHFVTIPDSFLPTGIFKGAVNEIELTIIDDGTVTPTCVRTDVLSVSQSCIYGTSVFTVNSDGFLTQTQSGVTMIIGMGDVSLTLVPAGNGDAIDWATSTFGNDDPDSARTWTVSGTF